MSEELKPCPKCKSNDLTYVYDDRFGALIKCYLCKFCTNYYKNIKEACKIWEGFPRMLITKEQAEALIAQLQGYYRKHSQDDDVGYIRCTELEWTINRAAMVRFEDLKTYSSYTDEDGRFNKSKCEFIQISYDYNDKTPFIRLEKHDNLSVCISLDIDEIKQVRDNIDMLIEYLENE